MRNTFLGLLAAAGLFAGSTYGAEPSSTAQDHTGLYQQEFRSVLAQHGWRVTRDVAGKLTAERRWVKHDGTTGFIQADQGGNTYARLQINFQTDAKNHPTASALASLCIYSSINIPEATYLVYPPLALRDPKLSKEYFEMTAETEAHLATRTGTKVAAK